MKKEITNNDLANAFDDFRKEIRQEFKSVRQEMGGLRQEMQGEFKSVRQETQDGFKSVRQEMQGEFKSVRQEITNLAESTAAGFTHVEGRLGNLEERMEKVETDTAWTRDILEKNTGTLIRLDQERYFTINQVSRLEDEIKKIKVELKIS